MVSRSFGRSSDLYIFCFLGIQVSFLGSEALRFPRRVLGMSYNASERSPKSLCLYICRPLDSGFSPNFQEPRTPPEVFSFTGLYVYGCTNPENPLKTLLNGPIGKHIEWTNQKTDTNRQFSNQRAHWNEPFRKQKQWIKNKNRRIPLFEIGNRVTGITYVSEDNVVLTTSSILFLISEWPISICTLIGLFKILSDCLFPHYDLCPAEPSPKVSRFPEFP